jgi:hypothetical protein
MQLFVLIKYILGKGWNLQRTWNKDIMDWRAGQINIMIAGRELRKLLIRSDKNSTWLLRAQFGKTCIGSNKLPCWYRGRWISLRGPRCRLGVHALGPVRASDGVGYVMAPSGVVKRRDASVGLLIYRYTRLLISSTRRYESISSLGHNSEFKLWNTDNVSCSSH